MGSPRAYDVMAVGINKAGHQGFSAKIDHLGVGCLVVFFDLGLWANCQNFPIPNGQCLGAGLRIVEGDDIATQINHLRRARG